MTNREYLGALVRQAREEKGLTQLQLADEVNLDVRTVKKLEAGQTNMTFDKFFPIVPFLHIAPNVLFHVSDYEEGIKMDSLYRKMILLSEENLSLLCENALSFQQWTKKHGEYSTVDEYYTILGKIE